MDRAPWWQQNIHKEILILELHEVSFKTTLDDDELLRKYEIQCQDIHGKFLIALFSCYLILHCMKTYK